MKPISVKMTFHEMKHSECRRLFSWVSLKLKTYGCVFNASSGKRWYYKTLFVANSSTCLVYILTFRRLQKMFSAQQQQQQDLNILNDKSFNGLYCAKLKKGKASDRPPLRCSKSFLVSLTIRKSFVGPDGSSGGAGKTPPSEAQKRKKSDVCWWSQKSTFLSSSRLIIPPEVQLAGGGRTWSKCLVER